jgi:hypothetical protein
VQVPDVVKPRLDLGQALAGIARSVCEELVGFVVVARQQRLQVMAGTRKVGADDLSLELRERFFKWLPIDRFPGHKRRLSLLKHMPPIPKEHGAYGQMAFPLATAFAVAGPSAAGVLIGLAMAAGFFGHEALLIALGFRGARTRREQGRRAAVWLICCGAIALSAGVGAAAVMPSALRWSLALPVVPVAWLGVAIAAGREKTWQGEVAAATAFSLVAVPVCLAAGSTTAMAFAVAIPFACMFVSGTLAVRAIIVNVRGGGDPRATVLMRRAVVAFAVAVAAGLAGAALGRVLPAATLIAAAPGLLVAVAIVAILPSPARLRTIGWTLVATSVTTAVIVIAAIA